MSRAMDDGQLAAVLRGFFDGAAEPAPPAALYTMLDELPPRRSRLTGRLGTAIPGLREWARAGVVAAALFVLVAVGISRLTAGVGGSPAGTMGASQAATQPGASAAGTTPAPSIVPSAGATGAAATGIPATPPPGGISREQAVALAEKEYGADDVRGSRAGRMIDLWPGGQGAVGIAPDRWVWAVTLHGSWPGSCGPRTETPHSCPPPFTSVTVYLDYQTGEFLMATMPGNL